MEKKKAKESWFQVSWSSHHNTADRQETSDKWGCEEHASLGSPWTILTGVVGSCIGQFLPQITPGLSTTHPREAKREFFVLAGTQTELTPWQTEETWPFQAYFSLLNGQTEVFAILKSFPFGLSQEGRAKNQMKHYSGTEAICLLISYAGTPGWCR